MEIKYGDLKPAPDFMFGHNEIKPAVLCCGLFLSALSINITTAFAQGGFVAGPYFVTPNFGTSVYGSSDHKVGNNQSLGGFVNINILEKLNISGSALVLATEYMGTSKPYNLGYGLGARPVFLPKNLRNTEIIISWRFHNKKIEKRSDIWGGDPVNKTYLLRGGILTTDRLERIKPTQVQHTVMVNNQPETQTGFISYYDITGISQQLISAGIGIDKYKTVTQYRNPFNRFQEFTRKRVYQQYFDVLYSVKTQYSDYGEDSIVFPGAGIPNLTSFGWKAGIRRITYNSIAHSFVFEFGQYPGQLRKPETDQYGMTVDDNRWKNWFVFVGFHLTIGHWFGDFD